MPVEVDGVEGKAAADGRVNGVVVVIDGAVLDEPPNVNGVVVVVVAAVLDDVAGAPKPPNAGKEEVEEEEGKDGAEDD